MSGHRSKHHPCTAIKCPTCGARPRQMCRTVCSPVRRGIPVHRTRVISYESTLYEARVEPEWVNLKCDGSIETSEGTIPNTLHRAADIYACYKCNHANELYIEKLKIANETTALYADERNEERSRANTLQLKVDKLLNLMKECGFFDCPIQDSECVHPFCKKLRAIKELK